MNWLTSLFSKSTAEPIEAVGNVLDKLFTSDDERLDKKIIMQRLVQRPAEVQAEINKIEARHRSIFVAGARPFIVWVCGLGLANVFLVNPWIQWITGDPGPQLPLEVMVEIIIAVLGLGALRTVEKLGGKAK